MADVQCPETETREIRDSSFEFLFRGGKEMEPTDHVDDPGLPAHSPRVFDYVADARVRAARDDDKSFI